MSNANFSPKTFFESRDTKFGSETDKSAISQDIFDFGLLMLRCAIGESGLFEFDEFVNKLKIFMEDYNKRPEDKSKYCCVIHSEEAINSIGGRQSASACLGLKDVLSMGSFSEGFTEFLCSCLKFDSTSRWTASSLLNSTFVLDQKVSGPLTTLSDLLKISSQLNKNDVIPDQYLAASEKQLEKLCNALSVLLSQPCLSPNQGRSDQRTHELKKLTLESPIIQDLAFDLGLQPAKVLKQLTSIVNDL